MSPIATPTRQPTAAASASPLGSSITTSTDERQINAKIVARLIPFLCALFVVNYLDRTNVAMAKLKMLGDTGISEAAYGLGAGLFFVGYFLFEVPSNLILEKVGARIWMTRIMITWGLICAAMMFVRGP
jgi:sugar phosphate permease